MAPRPPSLFSPTRARESLGSGVVEGYKLRLEFMMKLGLPARLNTGCLGGGSEERTPQLASVKGIAGRRPMNGGRFRHRKRAPLIGRQSTTAMNSLIVHVCSHARFPANIIVSSKFSGLRVRLAKKCEAGGNV